MFLTFLLHLSTSLSTYRNFFYSREISPLSTAGVAKLFPSFLFFWLCSWCLWHARVVHIYVHLSILPFMGSGIWLPGPPYPLPSHVGTLVSRLRNRLRKALGCSDLHPRRRAIAACYTGPEAWGAQARPTSVSSPAASAQRAMMRNPAPSASSFLGGKSEATGQGRCCP